MRILFLLFALLWSPLVGADELDFDVKLAATLEKQGESYKANFQLGSLFAGKSGMVNLTLNNPYDVDINFKDAKTNCKCIDFKTTSNSIPAKGSTTVQVKLKTPLRLKSRKGNAFVNLTRTDDRRDPLVIIGMTYDVAGLLAVNGQMVIFEIPENEPSADLRIGFMISPPVEFKNLEVTSTDALRDIEFKLEEKDQGGFIIATVSRDLVEAGPINGRVILKDSVTDSRDQFYCTVEKKDAVKIAPSVLRFQKDGANPDQMIAHAVIRFTMLRPTQPAAGAPARHPMDAVKVEASMGGKAVEVSRKNLSLRGVRVDFTIPTALISEVRKNDDTQIELALKVWDGTQSHDLKVGAIIIVE